MYSMDMDKQTMIPGSDIVHVWGLGNPLRDVCFELVIAAHLAGAAKLVPWQSRQSRLVHVVEQLGRAMDKAREDGAATLVGRIDGLVRSVVARMKKNSDLGEVDIDMTVLEIRGLAVELWNTTRGPQ